MAAPLSTAAAAGRVLVHLRTSGQKEGGVLLAKFTQSVVSALASSSSLDSSNRGGQEEGDEILVTCQLVEDKVVLSAACSSSDPQAAVPLRRPPLCPIKRLSEEDVKRIGSEVTSRGVAVGVVVLLETADSKILVTRRAKHMRTFPGVWVPPGGSVEKGEGLLCAGLRELQEETGLRVSPQDETRVLCLWESVYPPFLERGLPKRHHVVIYYHVRVGEECEALNSRLVLEPEEVDASAWLDKDNVELVVHGPNKQLSSRLAEKTFKMKLLLDDGVVSDVDCPAEVLFAKAPVSGVDVERFSSGTVFALSEWLKVLQR